MIEIEDDLSRNNPELLDIAMKCARDLGDYHRVTVGFGMFYRLLLGSTVPAAQPGLLSPLPTVTSRTRDMIVQQIDRKGAEAFTVDTIAEMELNNPELLRMAHGFASRRSDYLSLMQGFALFYYSLRAQSAADKTRRH